MASSKHKATVEIVGKDKLSKPIKKAKKSIDKLKKSSTGLAQILKTVLTVAAVKMAFEFAKMGAKITETEKAFENMTLRYGINGNKLIDKMVEITDANLTQAQAIEFANKSFLLMGKTIGNDLPKLMEIARASAIATGQDFSFMANSIIEGVGKSQKLILDNIGVVFDANEANKIYAASIGKTATELTEQERKTAFLNATIKAGQKIIDDVGDISDTTADKFRKFEATIKTLSETAQKSLAENTAPILVGLTKVINKMKEINDLAPKTSKEVRDLIISDALAMAEVIVVLDDGVFKFRDMGTAVEDLALQGNIASSTLEGFQIPMDSIIAKGQALQDSFKKTKKGMGLFARTSLQVADMVGQGFGQMAAGVEGAFEDMAKNILTSIIGALKQALLAQLVVDGVFMPARLPITLAGIAALSAMEAGIGAMGSGSDSSSSSSSRSSTPSTGGGVSSTPTAPVSSGGGGGGGTLNINITNPTFLSAADFSRTVDEMMVIAQENGWSLTLNNSVSVAE